MSPGYLARHIKQVPAVVVMFQDLWESTDTQRKDPLGGLQQVSNMERDYDQIIITRVNEQR